MYHQEQKHSKDVDQNVLSAFQLFDSVLRYKLRAVVVFLLVLGVGVICISRSFNVYRYEQSISLPTTVNAAGEVQPLMSLDLIVWHMNQILMDNLPTSMRLILPDTSHGLHNRVIQASWQIIASKRQRNAVEQKMGQVTTILKQLADQRVEEVTLNLKQESMSLNHQLQAIRAQTKRLNGQLVSFEKAAAKAADTIGIYAQSRLVNTLNQLFIQRLTTERKLAQVKYQLQRVRGLKISNVSVVGKVPPKYQGLIYALMVFIACFVAMLVVIISHFVSAYRQSKSNA